MKTKFLSGWNVSVENVRETLVCDRIARDSRVGLFWLETRRVFPGMRSRRAKIQIKANRCIPEGMYRPGVLRWKHVLLALECTLDLREVRFKTAKSE